MFSTVEEVRGALAGEGYIADERLATTVFLQTRLDKPLLIGPTWWLASERSGRPATAGANRL